MTTYEVTCPLVTVRDSAGNLHYYYAGAVLADGIPPAELERLATRGLITEVAEPAADPGPEGTEQSATVAAESATVQRPLQVAAKSAWVDYAVSRGMDRVSAELLTKQQLIDAYALA